MATPLSNGTTVLVPTNTFPPGTYHSAVYSLSAGQAQIGVSAARNNWPNSGSDVVSMTMEASLDGGISWQLLVGFTAAGGVVTNPWTHAVQATSDVTVMLPDPTNPNRQVRATVVIFSAINTAVSATVS